MQCVRVDGLCPGGWINEQSITLRWFQSVRTCPYSWATDRNNIVKTKKRFFIRLQRSARLMFFLPFFSRLMILPK